MICPMCHGKQWSFVQGTPRPCPECSGFGSIHCCEGLQGCPVLDELESTIETESSRSSRRIQSSRYSLRRGAMPRRVPADSGVS
ncbi:unnamed protein product [Tuwongella immobilis]|uniref:Uncharacterized protein n=1 Tax=Tuwongella immobilis TaxID=692036 RepID=A0A6C2YN23_9BACT|nr:unnamed protein product [Tuwongella immobilis]VTS03117.1 unnamed protein product [Tuwongella immobilis]